MTALPDELTTIRLRLPVVTPEESADMLAGRRRDSWHADYPRTDDLDAATLVRPGETWGPRHIVRLFDNLVVGGIGFFGPPDFDAEVPEAEVGYGLVAYAHGHGVATEALRALLAQADRVGVKVRASVQPDNRASIRVLAKCGFTELRGADEDGNLVMARPLPTPPISQPDQ